MEAIFGKKISKYDIEKQLESEGYHYHHTARARGYIRSGMPSLLIYSGRFGKGWALHSPNNESSRRSNNYHDISYYVK